MGVVLPRSTFLAKGSADFRAWLFDKAKPDRIDFLLNTRRWAFDMEPRYSVALLIAGDNSTAAVRVAGVADSAAAFAAQVTAPGLVLDRSALGPQLEVPLLRDQPEADLLAHLREGEPFALGAGRWRCFPLREFHETDDRRLWEGQDEGWPLWKGESFGQFDPHGAEARRCPPTDEALRKARKRSAGRQSLLASTVNARARVAAVEWSRVRARVLFSDVTNRTNSRTVLACLAPPNIFLVNSAPYLAFVDEDPVAQAACLAVLNSLPFDWQARRFVETHVSYFILEGLRVPTLPDSTFKELAKASARLSCPDERFADFAAASGVDVGPLDDEQRTRLRVDVDARVARAWGLSTEELELIFRDFTLDAVPAAYRDRVRVRFAELG